MSPLEIRIGVTRMLGDRIGQYAPGSGVSSHEVAARLSCNVVVAAWVLQELAMEGRGRLLCGAPTVVTA